MSGYYVECSLSFTEVRSGDGFDCCTNGKTRDESSARGVQHVWIGFGYQNSEFLACADTSYTPLYVGNLKTSSLVKYLCSFCSAILDQCAITSLNGSVSRVEVAL